MSRIAVILAAGAIACSAHRDVRTVRVALPWSDPDQVVPLDPRVREGHLPNGLTYYVMRLPEASTRTRLWLAVNAGSIEEDDDQLGVAHLVEHMAFRGTRHYPDAAIRDFVEHTGLDFGADLNAGTSSEQTIFKLAVSADDPALVDRGLDVLHEWASALTFDPAALDLERKIVIEEHRRRRERGGQRIEAQQRSTAFAPLRTGVRDPAGVPEVIARVPRDRVIRFYRDWYRPDLMAVIVVGDVDPDAMESMIRARFADLAGPAQPRPLPDLRGTPTPDPIVRVDTDPDAGPPTVLLIEPPRSAPARTVGDFRRDLAVAIYAEALDRRLEAVAAPSRAPIVGGAANDSRVGLRFRQVVREVGAEADRATNAAITLVTETLRAEERGFGSDELAHALDEVTAARKRALLHRGVVDGREEVERLAQHFLAGAMMPGSDDARSLLATIAPRITADEVRLAGGVHRTQRRLLVSGTDPHALPDPAQLRFLLTSWNAPTSAWNTRFPEPLPLIETRPAPGTIDREEAIADLGVIRWTLSNGALVLVKPLAADVGRVHVQIAASGGTNMYTRADAGAMHAAIPLIELEREKMKPALRRIHASVQLDMGPDSTRIIGRGPPEDLETLLQAERSYVIAPHPSPATVERWQKRMRTKLTEQPADSGGLSELVTAMLAYEAGGDPRLLPTTPEMIDALDPDRAYAIYREQLGDPSRLVITIAGDVDPEQARPLVERYLASIPRASTAPLTRAPLPIAHANGTTTIVRAGGVGDRSRVIYKAWASGTSAFDDEQDLVLLGRILDRHLWQRLRQRLGGVYDVETDIGLNGTGERTLFVSFVCAPESATTLAREAVAEIDDLRRAGVEPDEVAIVRAQSGRRHEDNLRRAEWWSQMLSMTARRGVDPRESVSPTKLWARISVDNLDRAAARNLVFDGSVLGILNPAPPVK